MQAIWKGAISFGLIMIPIRVFSATEEKSLRFNQLHADDMGRIRNNRTCTTCGKTDLTKDDLVRGYEYEKGAYVTLSDEELDAVPVETMHRVDVVSFVPSEQIDPVYYNRSYYLAPDAIGAKSYSLLRRALFEADKVALAKVTLRDKERMATLRVRDDVLVMETMHWPDEIRTPAFPELDSDLNASEKEIQLARTLIDSLTENFDPSVYEDQYRKALLEIVEAKVQGREIIAPPVTEEAPEVVDLMEALQKSLELVKTKREAERAAN